jgi:hypothetical protein
MTTEEAITRLQEAGLLALAKAGNPMLILGGQGYEPPEAPAYIGVVTGLAFFVYVKEGGFEVQWMSGPQQGERRDVATLDEAVRLIIENVPALPGV